MVSGCFPLNVCYIIPASALFGNRVLSLAFQVDP
jgi:hypothetical protein